jgi:hypothetical protein
MKYGALFEDPNCEKPQNGVNVLSAHGSLEEKLCFFLAIRERQEFSSHQFIFDFLVCLADFELIDDC